MPPPTSIKAYFELLNKSNLLSKEQLIQARDAVQNYAEPRGLAKWLVKRGWLTDWQTQQLLTGHHRLILGKYKLLEIIGQGGMGAVLKAEQSPVKRFVALKVMAKELLSDENAISRFQREIQLAASLNHPNIVAALDAGLIGDRYFLVMEFVQGRDLKKWLLKHGPLPISWSCEVVRQVALGLQHAHERGMVHRDIKPSNLIVSVNLDTGDPHVKIMDFGLSRVVSENSNDGTLTRTGIIMGSPDYIAPEQAISAKDADIRADLFSLGCTLFHMLTGQVPFPGNSVMEKLMSRATVEPPRVSSLRSEVPAALDELVAKLLKREPRERFQTPGELADWLATLDLEASAATQEPAEETADEGLETVVLYGTDDTLSAFLGQLSTQSPDGSSSDGGSSKSVSARAKTQPSWWLASAIAAICVIGVLLLLAAMSVGKKSDSTKDDSPREVKREPTKSPSKTRRSRD